MFSRSKRKHVNVLMVTPTREFSLRKAEVKIDNVLVIDGAVYKVDPRAVFTNQKGEKLVILYRMCPVAVAPETIECSVRNTEECVFNPAKLGEYIKETFSPQIQWLIKERYVREIYLKPKTWLVLLISILLFFAGLGLGLLI